MARIFRLAPLLMVLMMAARPAHADDKEAARQAFGEGKRLYDIADYASALEAFKKAYLHYEEPSFLFNIAQCYRQLDNKTEAIRFYRSYLRNGPDGDSAGEARRLIAALEAAHDKDKPSPAAGTAPPSSPVALDSAVLTATAPPPAVKRPLYKRWWLWTAVGVAAAGIATGVAVGVTANHPASTTFGPVVLQ
jgi:tetratricopeptide (TPR) repeat protein